MTILSLNTFSSIPLAPSDTDADTVPGENDGEQVRLCDPDAAADLPHLTPSSGSGLERILGIAPHPATVGRSDSAPSATLAYGSTGRDVKHLQHELNQWRAAHGLTPPLAEDGIFGPKTKNAVEAFQSANHSGMDRLLNNWKPDGIADASLQFQLRLANDLDSQT